MNRNKFLLLVSIVIVFILLGTGLAAFQWGVASAQEEAANQPMAVSGKTDALLQYQGRLSSPTTGEAVADGSYTMTLRLYTKAYGGSPIWTEIKDVPVEDGLFSTVLGDVTSLNRNHFDGRALWLGIKVGADAEATPRQQILPVAYALGLAPGASVEALNVDGDLSVSGKLKGGAHTHATHNNNPSAHHPRYTDAEAAIAALSHPEIVTQYEFDDHLYGGMHNGRAIAYGAINDDGTVSSATGNVSSRWYNLGKCYEITIDGHYYEWWSYVTVVTPVLGGGMPNVWHLDGKMCVAIFNDAEEVQKVPFTFVTFKP